MTPHRFLVRVLLALWIAGFFLVTGITSTVAQGPKPTPSNINDNIGPECRSLVSAPRSIIPIIDSNWSSNSYTADCAAGWANDQWQLTLSQSRSVDINVSDCCCPGDFYDLYVDGVRVGTTPRPSSWGCGQTGNLSTGTFTVVLAAGTHTIKVRDASFLEHTPQEIANARMCPAGFSIVGTLAAPPALPDLATLPIEFVNDTLSPFSTERMRINVAVKNIGAMQANNVLVTLFRGNPDAGGIQIDSQNLGTLAAGSQSQANFLWTLSGNVVNETLYARAYTSGQSETTTSNNTVSQKVSIYYAPFHYNPDTFSFANWSLDAADIINDLKAFVDLNHPENVTAAWTQGVIFPVASMVLESGGHCYGMASTSILFNEYPSIKPINKSTYSMTKDEARTDIQNYHRNQLAHVFEAIMMQTFGFDAQGEYNNAVHSIKDLHQPFMMIMYMGNKCGHAVVGYKLLDLGDEKRIYLYDNNVPLNSLMSDLYATVNVKNRTFLYHTPYLTNCGQDFTKFLVRPAELTPPDSGRVILNRFYNWVLNDLLKKNLIRVFTGSPVDPLTTDQYGRRVGYVNGIQVNEIPGASISSIGDKRTFDLPSNLTYTVTTVGTGSGTLSLQFMIPLSGNILRGVGYDSIPVSLGSSTSVSLSKGNSNWTLSATGQPPRQPDTLKDFQFFTISLPLISNSTACGTGIVNGGFEQGPGIGWATSSTTGRALIYAGGFPAPVVPSSGNWAAWLGGVDNEIAELSQTITMPANALSATLTYKYWVQSLESSCSKDHGWSELNGGILRLYNLCSYGAKTGWNQETIDLTPYLGQPITLKFHVDTDASVPSHLFIDDVNLSFQCAGQ